MGYLFTFLEGVITFISPCMLPMLPLYVAYFAGGKGKRHALYNSLGFVLGFTFVFVLLGAFAGTLGGLLVRQRFWVNLVSGLIVVLLGLGYLGVLRIPFPQLKGLSMDSERLKSLDFFSSILFGLVFAVGWTPCVWAFLGSALTLAATTGSRLMGIQLLLCFSLGLGIPFVVCALLIDQLRWAFSWLKKNYRIVNVVSGCLLLVMGVAMMTGWMGRILALLS